MNINPGELDKKIQIVHKGVEKTNENGFPIQNQEEVVRECYAKVSNTSGTELMKANSDFSEAKKRFLVRYTSKVITTKMCVRYNGKDYDIQYVNSYGDRKEYLEIWTYLEERV